MFGRIRSVGMALLKCAIDLYQVKFSHMLVEFVFDFKKGGTFMGYFRLKNVFLEATQIC